MTKQDKNKATENGITHQTMYSFAETSIFVVVWIEWIQNSDWSFFTTNSDILEVI